MRKKAQNRLSRLFFHIKLCMRKYLLFLTEAPDGTKYLSIQKFGAKGLVSRRVFVVTDELPCTPHIPGAKTIPLFLPGPKT